MITPFAGGDACEARTRLTVAVRHGQFPAWQTHTNPTPIAQRETIFGRTGTEADTLAATAGQRILSVGHHTAYDTSRGSVVR